MGERFRARFSALTGTTGAFFFTGVTSFGGFVGFFIGFGDGTSFFTGLFGLTVGKGEGGSETIGVGVGGSIFTGAR